MKNMITAFALNLLFAIFEFFGGLYTNSITLMSDAIHDLGDALSIGMACFWENKSKKPADNNYTFGYSRYSIFSAAKTSVILITGACIILINAVNRIFNPQPINYNGMVVIAIIGFVFNILAVFFTRHGDSLNEKSINLHMLEDVLGWAIVLVGSIIMKFTDFAILDIILSIGTSGFVLLHAIVNLRSATNILVNKVPAHISVRKLKSKILLFDGIKEIHNFRIWNSDEHNIYAILHLVVDDNFVSKEQVRNVLYNAGVTNVTIELETNEIRCGQREHVVGTTKHVHHHIH